MFAVPLSSVPRGILTLTPMVVAAAAFNSRTKLDGFHMVCRTRVYKSALQLHICLLVRFSQNISI